MTFVSKLVDSYVRGLGPRGLSAPKRARWTLARVAGMMEAEFGAAYSSRHVRTILIRLLGDDQWLLSRVSFWARLIELVYPEWAGRVLIEDFADGLVLSPKIVSALRRRLQS